jgi:hypothetical protein
MDVEGAEVDAVPTGVEPRSSRDWFESNGPTLELAGYSIDDLRGHRPVNGSSGPRSLLVRQRHEPRVPSMTPILLADSRTFRTSCRARRDRAWWSRCVHARGSPRRAGEQPAGGIDRLDTTLHSLPSAKLSCGYIAVDIHPNIIDE